MQLLVLKKRVKAHLYHTTILKHKKVMHFGCSFTQRWSLCRPLKMGFKVQVFENNHITAITYAAKSKHAMHMCFLYMHLEKEKKKEEEKRIILINASQSKYNGILLTHLKSGLFFSRFMIMASNIGPSLTTNSIILCIKPSRFLSATKETDERMNKGTPFSSPPFSISPNSPYSLTMSVLLFSSFIFTGSFETCILLWLFCPLRIRLLSDVTMALLRAFSGVCIGIMLAPFRKKATVWCSTDLYSSNYGI